MSKITTGQEKASSHRRRERPSFSVHIPSLKNQSFGSECLSCVSAKDHSYPSIAPYPVLSYFFPSSFFFFIF